MAAPATALDGLRAAVDDVREAADADAVDGVAPRLVARPRSTAEVSAALRATGDAAVVVRGAGTRMSWGAPPSAVDVVLDLSAMDAVVAHAPGDLVVTVQPGLGVAALQDALAPSGQRLALDLPVPGGTVGGTIATASAGPLRYRYGSVRDLLIGITVVRADGTVAKSGGTVVKNVAGYDLGKLYTGSLGTLGVITEAVFRLHPVPDAARWTSVVAADPARAGAALAAVRAAQHDPVALEVDRPERGGPTTVVVALEGSAGGIDARTAALEELLADAAGAPVTTSDAAPGWWGAQPALPVAQVTVRPTGVRDLLAEAPGAVRGSAGAGVLAVGLDAATVPADLARLRELAVRHGGAGVLRAAAPEHKRGVDVWGPVPALALMRRLKDEFDPQHRLSPGRFVGGI